MSPEVLIYLQNVKNYLKSNEDARKLFLENVDEEVFYKHLGEMSQKNFDTNGEAMLTQEQFNLLRKTVKDLKLGETSSDEITLVTKFINIKGFGKICLN